LLKNTGSTSDSQGLLEKIHLNILEQIGYTNKFRHNNITRYYPLNIPTHDLKVLSHLGVPSERRSGDEDSNNGDEEE
jgi:hypothetical protein